MLALRRLRFVIVFSMQFTTSKEFARMQRLNLRIVCLIAVLAGMLGFTSIASAAWRPYLAHGTAQFVSPTDFIGQGDATHLNHYTEAGSVAFAPTSNPDVLRVTGTTSYTATNGDRLDAQVYGTLNTATGAVRATLIYVGGTGRFDHAWGVSRLSGQMGPNNSMAVTVIGLINF